MLMRHGVRLSPRQADVFDMIEKATRAGRRISTDVLAGVLYPNAPRQGGKNVVRVTINHINDMLVSTNVRINCRRGCDGGYAVGIRIRNATFNKT
jgi:hypothetical protein